jgi:hypothetical protein
MGKVLAIGALVGFGAFLAKELPGLKRYQKISGM